MSEKSDVYVRYRTALMPGENYTWGPGIHNDYVLHYILDGKGTYETDGKHYTVNKNESFIIFPGKIVKYYPDKADPWKYTWVNFSGSKIKDLLSLTAFNENPVAPPCKELNKLFDAFSNEIQLTSIELKNKGLLEILLSYYIDIHPASVAEKAADYLYTAKQYIAANSYRHDFGVNELANAVGIERSYLYRLFMEKEGVSPSEYIIDIRLKNAMSMLKNGARQVKLVSYSVGYENPLYFSNCFKKKYGVSPKYVIKDIANDK